VSTEPAVLLIKPFECWDTVYFWFHPNFPTMWSIFVCYGTLLALVIRPLNSILCFKSAVWWNLLALIVQQLLLIFVGFCCEGLLAFIPVSLQLSTIVHCNWRVQCCDFIFTITRSKKVTEQLVVPVEKETGAWNRLMILQLSCIAML